MRFFLVSVVVGCFIALAFAAESGFDYRPNADWQGTCISGIKQSPINIVTASVERPPKGAGKADIEDFGILDGFTAIFTGANLEVKFKKWVKEAKLRIPANEYTIGDSTQVKMGDMLKVEPQQLHFHTLSEHTIDGFYAPGEIHIVTRVKDGESDYCDAKGGCLAVFGIMTTYVGDGEKSNKALSKLMSAKPEGVGEESGDREKGELNLNDLLPTDKTYYSYLGSLTTPPCTEIVVWHVFAEPIPISAEDIENHQTMVAFTPGPDCTYAFYGVCVPPREKTNYRPVQLTNGRPVYSVKP